MPSEAQVLFDMEVVVNSKNQPPDQMWFVALSLFEPQDVFPPGGIPVHIEPSNTVMKTCTIVRTDHDMVWSSLYLARRVRNYLAAVAGVLIPFCHVVSCRDLVFAGKTETGRYPYCPMDIWLKESRLAGWQRRLEQTPLITERLLNGYSMGSPEDRALMLLGEAKWILPSDPENAFLSLWRALEVVGRVDFRCAQENYAKGNRALAAPYLENHAGDLLNGRLTRVSNRTKVLVSVRARCPGTSEEFLKEMSELRGALSHDSTSVKHYQRVSETFDKLNAVARGVVRSLLPEGSLFPSFHED
ncbi:MAG: hypothetical protein JRN35_09780 [Nitrososphaerota archaeon]|nr:hypothetical protein [Nitrososphaerota archaeon]